MALGPKMALPSRVIRRTLPRLELLSRARIEFHGVRQHQPDTSFESRSLAVAVWVETMIFYLILNAYWEALEFELLSLPGTEMCWRRIIDTSAASPDDYCDFEEAPLIETATYHTGPRSVVLLACEKPPG